MFINPITLTLIKKSIAALLVLDSQLAAQLTPLNGKTIAWRYKKTDHYIYFSIDQNTIEVHDHCSHPPDVVIATGLISWVRLLPGKNQFGSNAVKIEGDLAVLQQLQSLLETIELDGEGWLANKIGEIPAHRMFKIIALIKAVIIELFEKGTAMSGDYLTQEKRSIIGRDEMRVFCDTVSTTRESIDKLEHRIDALKRKA